MMELNDALRRIFGQHWRMIAAFVVVSVGVAAALQVGNGRSFTASARVVLDTQDPESRSQSAAIADTARAIVTSPSQVSLALRAGGIKGRDPVDVAEHHVSLRSLGSSAVLQLSVSDADRQASAAIANALANRLIRTRLGVTQGQVQQVLGDLAGSIEDLNSRISDEDAKIDSLNVQIAAASSPTIANALRARRDEVSRVRDFLAQQRSVIESQRVSLLSTDSLRPRPTIISRAVPPESADSSGLVASLGLAALLGLVLGVGLAGLIETLRPTLVGSDALAREVRAPVLGSLAGRPDDDESLQHVSGVAGRLRMAAEAAGLHNVALISAGPPVDVAALAEMLETTVRSNANGEHAAKDVEIRAGSHKRARGTPRLLRIRPFAFPEGAGHNGSRAGLVLVAPATVKKSVLGEADLVLAIGNSPILGLITYPRTETWRQALRLEV